MPGLGSYCTLDGTSVSTFGKLVLADYRTFVPVVAKAYLARPDFDQKAVPSWKALIAHVEHMFEQLQARVRVEFVGSDPYSDYDALAKDIRENRRMKIFTGNSDHAVFSDRQNWKFRAVHDYMAHFAGGHKFSLRGEISAYNRHVKTVPPAARPALFTEVVGQVCTFHFLDGKFAPQKIAILYGFDYVNVGNVDQREYARNFS